MKSVICLWVFIATLLFAFLPSCLVAEEPTSLVSPETIENKIKSVSDSTVINEENKTKLLERYQQVLDLLDDIKKNRASAAAYISSIKKLPEETQIIRDELEKETDKNTAHALLAQINEQTSSAELEQLLLTEKANLAAIEAKNSELKQQLAFATNRAGSIRNRLTDINLELEQIKADKELLPADQSAEMQQANQWLYDTQMAALQSEIKKLDQELLSQPIRLEHMNAEYELNTHNIKWMSRTIDQFEEMLNQKRDSQAREVLEASRQARQQVSGKPALVQEQADINSKLSEEISNISLQLSRLSIQEDYLNDLSKSINNQFNNTRRKLDVAGLSPLLGPLLLKERSQLPDEHEFEKRLERSEADIVKVSLSNLQHRDELEQISDIEMYINTLINALPEEQQQAVYPDLASLVRSRKELLEKLTDMEITYLRSLENMSYEAKKLQDIVSDYRTLLSKQLFWVRTSDVISWESVQAFPGHIMAFISQDKWFAVFHDFISSLKNSPIRLLGYLIALLLLLKSSQIKQMLIDTGKNLRKISTDKFSYTIKALFFTLVLALPWPLITAFTGQQLRLSEDPGDFSQSVSTGLIWIVRPMLFLIFLRKICLPQGLAEIHFKWHPMVIQRLNKALGRLMLVFLPVLFLSAIIFEHGFEAKHAEFTRLVLILTLLSFSLFFFRLIKREDGILSPLIKQNPDGFLARYYNFWLFLVIIDFSSLLTLVLIGYIFTAAFLLQNFIHTIWLIFALILVHQLILRWLLLSRRKLALKAAIARRKAVQAEKASQREEDESEQTIIEVSEPEVDLISLSITSNKLLKTLLFLAGIFGLAGIWAEVLPALTIFDDVSLWHRTGIVNGEEKIIPVTLGNVALGLLVALLTVIGARQIPSIIEIILLQQPSVTSGSRYTFTTLTKYAIMGIGAFTALNLLGADWAKFQWLFAALGVGIGFGLQEIVANFISGIIILFERPIRIGDYVSVGNNEGIVSKIQIRATTILTFDRKELLVPNKEFITGQLLNWSLSDPTSRIIIPVGVAYGSDILKAKELLLQTALENERVLDDPAPWVVFYSFGDNTLDLQLRCFITDVSLRLSTISDLNEVINSKFNAAGISIAFPQRDIHLDIERPIDVRLHKSMAAD